VLELWTQRIIKNADPLEAMQQSFVDVKKQKKYLDLHIEKYLDEIKPWLRGFFERYQQHRFVPLAAEQKVGFKYRNIIVIGRIDRIDYVDNRTIKILDYKSTKDPKYLTNLQLGMYHMAVKYGELKSQYGDKEVQTAYVLLRHDMKEAPYEFSVPDLDACLDEIETTVQQIQTDTTWEARPSNLCQYCDYFVPCMKERENVDNWW